MGPFGRLLLQQLGFTFLMDNPDSWEGWLWGAAAAWGYYWKLGRHDNFDMPRGRSETHRADYFLGCGSPNTSAGGYNGQESNPVAFVCKELGIKFYLIDPWCNFTAATWGDKWIAPRPGRMPAMAEPIAYVWIKRGPRQMVC